MTLRTTASVHYLYLRRVNMDLMVKLKNDGIKIDALACEEDGTCRVLFQRPNPWDQYKFVDEVQSMGYNIHEVNATSFTWHVGVKFKKEKVTNTYVVISSEGKNVTVRHG